MTSETYTVELTFRQWMDICHALGHTESMWRMKNMEGQANQYQAIQTAIMEQMQDK